MDAFQKNFAIAYDRVICLIDGEYQIYSHNMSNYDATRSSTIKVNGSLILESHTQTGAGGRWNAAQTLATLCLARGDYVQIFGVTGGSNEWITLDIRKV